ncbi:MAG: flagellar hook-basal body complex protein FliE [Erythrobacter sp.]
MSPIRPAAGIQDVLALRQEVLGRSQALKDVRAASTTASTAETAGASVNPNSGPDFANTLGDALQQVSATQRNASEMSAAYERGEVTDIAQVMLARQEAGVAFEATLQVRNRLLSAYQDIMRMGS